MNVLSNRISLEATATFILDGRSVHPKQFAVEVLMKQTNNGSEFFRNDIICRSAYLIFDTTNNEYLINT